MSNTIKPKGRSPRGKNNGCNEIIQSTSIHQEKIMTEKNPTAPATEAETPEVEVVVEPNFLVKVGTKYPRASRAAAIIVGVAAAAGGVTVLNTARKNKHHLNNATDHVLEAGSEFSQAVSPTPETTDA